VVLVDHAVGDWLVETGRRLGRTSSGVCQPQRIQVRVVPDDVKETESNKDSSKGMRGKDSDNWQSTR
jgi:hypothetical protein